MNMFWMILPILFLSGCAGMPCKKSPLIQVGNPDQIQDCHLLKTFTGPVSYRMWGTPYIGNFEDQAMDEAEKMGATHVLWRSNIDGIESTPVLKAYKCPPNSEVYRNKDEYIEEE
jgi:hypothetical protein